MQPQIDSMKTILVFFLIFVIIPAGVFSETIRLKDGRVLRAEIIEETPQYIKVNIHGIPITYYRDQIKRIEGKRPISADTPREAPAHSASGKSPAQIFKEVSDEVVVVIAQMSSGVSQGSGFIIDRNGVVVTNFHVVGGAEEIEVKFKDGRAFPVVGIIDYDVNRDICVLKIDAYGLDTVALGNSNYLQPGSKVLVIGAPLGLEYSITEGLYSGKRKFLKKDSLQFSAPISPGNSGGPLLDMDGKVVGITTFIKPGGQNLNFAIPVNEARRYFKTIPKMSMREFAAKLSKAYSYYKSARDAVYAQDLDGAIRYMREAVETDPTFIAGHIYLASLYTLTGRLDMSITQLKKAISADPENVDARNELGAAYFERRMFKPAIKEFERAIAIDSRNAMSYSNIAAAYEKQNNLDEAAKMLKEALRLDPDYAMAHKNLGWVYFRRGMVREAIAQTKKAILFDPYDSHTYYNLSWIYHEDGQYELAVKYCEKAMGLGQKIDPGYMEKLRPYRKTTAAAGGSEEVRSSFSDAEMRKIINKMDSETAELARLGADAYSAGKYHLALQYQKKALSRVQKGTAAYDLILELVAIDYLDIGLEYMNNGLFDPAIEYLNEGIFVINSAHSPFLDFMRVKAYEYLAFCHAEKGDKTKAEDYIRKVHSVSQEKAQVLKKKIHEEYGY